MLGCSYHPPPLNPHTQTQRWPSLQIPLSLSAAASGVWARIDKAYFWSHHFSHAHLILRFIKQDLGWQRTLASVHHSFSSHWSAPLCLWYLQGRLVHCRLNPKQRNMAARCFDTSSLKHTKISAKKNLHSHLKNSSFFARNIVGNSPVLSCKKNKIKFAHWKKQLSNARQSIKLPGLNLMWSLTLLLQC